MVVLREKDSRTFAILFYEFTYIFYVKEEKQFAREQNEGFFGEIFV